MAQRVYHWKHGWIPLDHVAAVKKYGSAGAARFGFSGVSHGDLPRGSHVAANFNGSDFHLHDTQSGNSAMLSSAEADRLQASGHSITGVGLNGQVTTHGVSTAAPTPEQIAQGMRTAEFQRHELEGNVFIKKGRGKGNYDPDYGWTSETRNAWKQYTEMGHQPMNEMLRDPEGYAAKDPDFVEYVQTYNEQLQSLISKNTTTEDMTVMRGVTHDVGHLRPGDNFADPGFLSTTTDAAEATNFATGRGRGPEVQGWTFVISVPKGSHAVAGADYQREVVLQAGQTQVVDHVDHTTNTIFTRLT